MEEDKNRPPEKSKKRVQRCRERKTDEEKKMCKEKNKSRMEKKREKMTDEEKKMFKEKNKSRMEKKRAEMTDEERNLQKEKNRVRMAKRREENKKRLKEEKEEKRVSHGRSLDQEYKRRRRSTLSKAVQEYERIMQLLRNRKARSKRNGKDHLLDNLEAKQGMRWLREDGRVLKFKERLYYRKSEMEIWKIFYDLGSDYKEILKEKKKEVFEKIVEEEDKKKEEEKRKKNPDYDAIQEAIKAGHWGTGENEGYVWIDKSYGRDWFWARDEEEPKKGEWVFRGGDYFWDGEGDPPEEADPNMDTNQFNWTEEDEQRFKEQKEEEIEMSLATMRQMMKCNVQIE